jgi:hypothetical protein
MKAVILIFLTLTLAGCAAAPPQELDVSSSRASSADAATVVDAPAGASVAAPTIDRPPTYSQGYKLSYRSRTSNFDITYKGEEDGLLVFHYDTRGKLPFDYLYTPDLKLAGINNAQEQSRFEPPVGYVDFPLFVGKKWSVAYKATSNARQSMGETSVEVLAFESVRVPYGAVNAFRIRVRNSNRQVTRMNPYETYWYSPDIGYFVKHETNKPVYEDPYELIAVSK